MAAGARREDDVLDVRATTVPGGPEVLGSYRLIHVLGEGGMGVVHLALDRTGRAVAVKVLRPHVAHDAAARSRLARELDTLSRVRDPGVAALLDADLAGNRPYLVTQYVPGPSLEDVVRERGPLRGDALLRLGEGLAEALRAVHAAGVVHRDLKPGNVLLLDGRPILIDFGIAHVADDVRLTVTGLVMGTPGYLSPEVVEGDPVTEATDWWGWAATLTYAASGRPPFGRGPMNVVLDRVRGGRADLGGVDPRLAPLLQAALSPDPDLRPGAAEVVAGLRAYAAGGPATLGMPQGRAPEQPGPVPTSVIRPGATRLAPQGPGPSAFATPFPSAEPAAAPVPLGGASAVGSDGRRGEVQPGQVQPGEVEPGEDGRGDALANGAVASRPTDPRAARPGRTGSLASLLLLLVAVAARWPAIALAMLVLWSLVARFADRAITSRVIRRHEAGPRRSDLPVSVVSAPWHLLSAAVATVLGLLLPCIVAAASALCAALLLTTLSHGAVGQAAIGQGAVAGASNAVTAAAGALGGALMAWWGPGGASLRRGSRSVVRAVAPARGATVVVVACVVAAAAVAAWALLHHGGLAWWPLPGPPLSGTLLGRA